jgi:hypothetical protein
MRAYDWRHLLKSATISDLNLTRALSFLAQPKRYKLPPPSPLHGKSPVRTEPERARIFQESSLTEEPDSTVIEADSIQPLLINGIITLKNGLRNPLRIQSTICSSASRDRFSTHIRIHHGKEKGRIEIEYYGNDDLDRILLLLGLSAVL